MKYIVPIDRETVKKNPRAGNQAYQYSLGPQPPSVTVVGQDTINGPWVERTWIGSLLSSIQEVPAPKDKALFLNITQKQDIQNLYTLSPEPLYLYEYKDTLVKCEDCGAEFSYKLLEEDWSETYDEESHDYDCYHIDNICPKCKASDCCELEFEKV